MVEGTLLYNIQKNMWSKYEDLEKTSLQFGSSYPLLNLFKT